MSCCNICGRDLKDHKKTIGDVCSKEVEKIKKKHADKEQERLEKSQEYIHARKSIVPNLGVEIPGAARISYHQYKNVKDIEELGPAAAQKLILKKNLIANMPIHTEGAASEDIVRLSLARKAVDSFPKGPDYPKKMNEINEGEPLLALVKGFKSMNSIVEISQDRETLEKLKKRFAPSVASIMEIVEFDSLESMRKKIRSDYFDRYKYMQEYFNDKNNFIYTGAIEADRKKLGDKFFRDYFNEFGIKMPNRGRIEQFSIHKDDSSFFNKMRHYNSPNFLKNKLDENGLAEVTFVLNGNKVKKESSETKKSDKPRSMPFNPIVFYPYQVLERKGPEAKEKNIDEIISSLENKWGFKGVQNGNTVSDKERLEHYSHANTALMDLMDALKIKDPKKMTFNGNMSLAIGSLRGRKNALAFYAQDIDTIALSRKNGLGSLSHEWGHALEHHFIQKNKKSSGVAVDDGFGAKIDVFANKMRQSEEFRKATSKHKKYLASNEEVFARVFEAMVNHKLEKMGRKNTYLVSHSECYAYPTKAELSEMEADFDNAIKSMLERS